MLKNIISKLFYASSFIGGFIYGFITTVWSNNKEAFIKNYKKSYDKSYNKFNNIFK